MNEKATLEILMRNPAFREALKELIINDEALARDLGVNDEKPVFVWCVEMVTADGTPYYHPLVVPARMGAAPSMEEFLDVNFYQMMADENQFNVYRYESMVNMFRSVYTHPVRLLTIPKKTYETLVAALQTLIATILAEAEVCFTGIDNIARLTHTNVDTLKCQFMMAVFSNMNIVSSCIDQAMNVHDSENHGYTVQKRCECYDDEDWDDEEGEEDYDDYAEDEDFDEP